MNLTSPWPHFAEDEISAVEQVLKSGKVNYWTGEQGRLFENEFAECVGAKHAVAMSNGTVTIEAALRVLGISPGDEVIVPCKTFVATASAVLMCGATPIFADVDLDSQNITVDTIKEKLTKKTKAVIPVHFNGWPCEMDKIMDLAKSHNLFVIEDCAQAHGAEYQGRKIGSWGHIASFSFCQDKIMTTGGEGGMVTTNDTALWQKLWAVKDHGKNYDTVYHKQHPLGFRWLHEAVGTNWRMTEMQAAIGRCQLKKLPDWLVQRAKLAQMFSEGLAKIDCFKVMDLKQSDIKHANYKYYTQVDLSKLKQGWSRDRLMAELVNRGIPCFSGSCSEIYQEKVFTDLGLEPEARLKNAAELTATSLVFLIHPTLCEEQVAAQLKIIAEVCLGAM